MTKITQFISSKPIFLGMHYSFVALSLQYPPFLKVWKNFLLHATISVAWVFVSMYVFRSMERLYTCRRGRGRVRTFAPIN